MDKNNLDNQFKNNLENLEDIPSNLNWETHKMWKDYKKTYQGRSIQYNILKIAAVFIFVAASVYIFNKSFNLEYTEISTGTGEKTRICLSNGSIIWLNSNSKIRYPEKYSKKTMKIYVEGEAYFELNEERKNPIIIVSGNTLAQVYESSFNIRSVASESNIEITVTKGNIEVDSKTDSYFGSMEFSEGEKASIHRSNKLIFSERNPDHNVIAWKTGNISFDEVPLYFVLKKLEKMYDIEIKVENNNINSCKITLNSHFQNIEDILTKITNETNSKYVKTETGFILYNGFCSAHAKI